MVISMIRNIIIFIALLIILLCVISTFNARSIAKMKFKSVEENKVTKLIKGIGFIICVFMLILIYLYR